MKRSMIILLAAVLVMAMTFALTGCGSDSSESEQETPATEAQQSGAAFTEADTTFIYNGVSVALDGDLNEAIAGLGEAKDVKSELSCHGEGDDKTYTYDGFVVKSYPKDGVDRVLEVLISEAGIPTAKGIQVGSSLADVKVAYGDETNQVAKRYVYDGGNGKTLRFVVENDVVTQIDYYFNV